MHEKFYQNIYKRSELNLSGYSNYRIEGQINSGELVKTAPGVYAYRNFLDSLSIYERPFVEIMSVIKSSQDPVLSHHSAALWAGAPLIYRPDKVHLSVPTDGNRRRQAIFYHRNRAKVCQESIMVEGVRITDYPQILSDAIESMPFIDALNVSNYLLAHNMISFKKAYQVCNRPRRRRGKHAQLLLERMNLQCESPLETLVFNAICDWRLPRPEQQVWLSCQGKQCRVDFLWKELRLIVEADGKIKYGGTFGDPTQVIRAERARQRELERQGWKVIRVEWKEIFTTPQLFKDRLFQAGLRPG